MTREFELRREQLLPADLEQVFAFFADAYNLEAITPEFLRFRVLGLSTPTIREGTTIDYRLRLRGVPLRWRSRISSWRPPHSFVDEQVHGPYLSWHHLHTFEERPEGVLMRDRVRYRVPGGALVERLFVRRDLERIFNHRAERIAERFGRAAEHQRSA